MSRQSVDDPTVAGTLSAPGFVGRDDQLAQLTDALAGPPALVLIEGEAGIGKTRLVHECKTRLVHEWLNGHDDRGTLVTVCPPVRQPYTLGPIVDAVRQATDSPRALRLSNLAGALRPLFPEWADDLPPAPDPLDDVTAARHRLFRASLELLTKLNIRTLVVEDAHWADDATLELLLLLASRRPPPASVVVTFRPEEVAADSLLRRLTTAFLGENKPLRLALDPLDVRQTAQFVSSMLSGEQVSDGFAQLLHGQTDGVPLALEEVMQLLHDRADLTKHGDRWVRRYLEDVVVPPTVRDAVLERLSRLGDSAQAIARASAVFTEPASHAALREVSGLPENLFGPALGETLNVRLLSTDARGKVSFHHALAGRAVYEAITDIDRRAMHRRAGRFLEGTSPPPVGQLARHFKEAGDLDDWGRHAERAADLARATGDEALAADLLCNLLVAGHLPAARVAELAAKVPLGPIYGTPRCDDLRGVIRMALGDHALDSCTEAELRLLLGQIMSQMGESDAGKAEIAQAVEGLGHAPGRAALAMASLGMPMGLAWPAHEHLTWVERAGRLTESLAPAERLYITVGRMSALLLLGDASAWRLADEIPDEPPTAQMRESVIRGHVNLADGYARWGWYTEARDRFAKAKSLIDRDQYPHVVDLVQESERHLDWFTGDWTALDDLRDGDGPEDEAFDHEWNVVTAVVAGLLQAAIGMHDRAERNLEAASAAFRRSGTLYACPEVAAALAQMRLQTGEAGEALRLTDDQFDIVTGKQTWLWATELLPVRVEALIAVGKVEEAADSTAAFADGLRGRDIPASRAGLTLCRGMVAGARGDNARAEVLLGRAAARWEALPRPYDALLARERRAGTLATLGRDEECVDELREVHRGLSELGAVVAATRVEARLHELGVTVRRQSRRGRRGYGDELSPRELEVVRQVALGRSNQEIADALFRSPKTVAAQLRSAKDKLGVPSRTAVAMAAVERGLVDPGGENSPK